MIDAMKIQGFRCFRDFKVHDMNAVTLIGGENNAGKSALLEALFLNMAVNVPGCFQALAQLRNGGEKPPVQAKYLWSPLFYRFRATREIMIQITSQGNTTSFSMKKGGTTAGRGLLDGLLKDSPNEGIGEYLPWLELEYRDCELVKQGNFVIAPMYGNPAQNQVQFAPNDHRPDISVPLPRMLFYKVGSNFSNNTVAEWVSKACMTAVRKQQLLQMLQNFDEAITNVMTVIDDGVPYVYITRSDEEQIPLRYMGDGINKAIRLLLGILNAEHGVLMIDEIENGFYYDYYHEILSGLYRSALQMDCQLLITTHNRDILQTSVEVMKELGQQDKLSYQRMERRGEDIKAYAFDGHDMERAFVAGMEVR